jgi:hypothetical protein
MSVLGAAERSEMELVTAGITASRPRLAVASPLAGGPAAPAAARKRRAGGAYAPAPAGPALSGPALSGPALSGPALSGPAPARLARGERELRVREVRVREVHVRELRTGPGQAGRVRLTRRGRVVLAAFAVMAATALVMLFWLSVAGGAQASSHGLRPGAAYQGMTRVVVQPGQTLWSIASQAEPTADPRLVIQQITEVNALSSPVIQPGESLWVPKG